MKRKQIEKVPVKSPWGRGRKRAGKRVAAQLSGGYLILDLWNGGTWICRHAMDVETGEYASCDMTGLWTEENLQNAFACGDFWTILNEERLPISAEGRRLVLDALKVSWPCSNVYERIESLELEHSRDRRYRKEERRVQRVAELMASVPDVGKDVIEWIGERVAGSQHYAIWDKEPGTSGTYHCTACGGSFGEAAAGIRMKHKGEAACPLCGQALTVEKRRASLRKESRLTLIHGLDDKRGIQRHFTVTVVWDIHRVVRLHETIRCMLHKGAWSRYQCDFYYLQHGAWDNKGNPCNCRWRTGYLYQDGIQEGLEGTAYSAWADVFQYMASMGMRANYDRLLADVRRGFIGMVEYLAKGRFYRLLEETSEQVQFDHGYGIYNALNVIGEDICEVMHIWDMQKIVRLRQEDGDRKSVV